MKGKPCCLLSLTVCFGSKVSLIYVINDLYMSVKKNIILQFTVVTHV